MDVEATLIAALKRFSRETEGALSHLEEGFFLLIHPVPNEPDLLPDPVLDHNAMSVIKQRQMAPN